MSILTTLISDKTRMIAHDSRWCRSFGSVALAPLDVVDVAFCFLSEIDQEVHGMSLFI